MTALSPIVGRGLAMGLFLALVGIIVFAVAVPIYAYSARLGADLEQSRATIARLQGIVAARQAFESGIAAFNADEVEATVYLSESSAGVAAASLQELVGDIADDVGVDVKSTQALPVEVDHGLQRVAVRVVLECTIASLADVLAELESEVPFIFAANLEVRSQRGRRADAVPEDTLLVSVDLYGYLRGRVE